MHLDRRSILAGSLASVALPSAARTPAPDFAAASAYSIARNGVSLLVMRGTEVLLEDYSRGDPEAFHELASGTKSFSGVMAAALVQDGLLSLDEPCVETLPEWRTDPLKQQATVRSLLHLASGAGGGRLGAPEPYSRAVAAPFAGAGVFRYGPTPFQIFGEIVRRKLVAADRANDVLAYLSARILDPAGVQVGRWRQQDGQPNLPSGALLTARNWARFGRFVLDGGVVAGRQTVDAATLAANFRPSPANPGYGLTWWLLRPGLIPPGPRSPIDVDPAKLRQFPDVRMAAGAGDQRLYLIPERDMLIVRQADRIMQGLRGGSRWSDADFLQLLLT